MQGPPLAEGKLIILAGIDGSGKATRTDRLVRRLERTGRSVETFDFPQYEATFFGRLVARYLRGEFGEAANVSSYLASLLYGADRWQVRGGMAYLFAPPSESAGGRSRSQDRPPVNQ